MDEVAGKCLLPIETKYGQSQFRSRLEARWATFFNTIDLPWQYERQTFSLPNGLWYLPDFWLPTVQFGHSAKYGVWLEVKPTHPTPREVDKAWGLAERTLSPVVVVTGLPRPILQVDGEAHYAFNAHILPCGKISLVPSFRVTFVQCVRRSCGALSMQTADWGEATCPNCEEIAHDGTSLLIAGYRAAYSGKFRTAARAKQVDDMTLRNIGLERLGTAIQGLIRKNKPVVRVVADG